jgi:hypothetical protein
MDPLLEDDTAPPGSSSDAPTAAHPTRRRELAFKPALARQQSHPPASAPTPSLPNPAELPPLTCESDLSQCSSPASRRAQLASTSNSTDPASRAHRRRARKRAAAAASSSSQRSAASQAAEDVEDPLFALEPSPQKPPPALPARQSAAGRAHVTARIASQNSESLPSNDTPDSPDSAMSPDATLRRVIALLVHERLRCLGSPDATPADRTDALLNLKT